MRSITCNSVIPAVQNSVEDLSKQFSAEKLTCVLDYMKEYQPQENFIFRNYTVLFRHVFEGLCYLKSKGIVHRDIKCKENLMLKTTG